MNDERQEKAEREKNGKQELHLTLNNYSIINEERETKDDGIADNIDDLLYQEETHLGATLPTQNILLIGPVHTPNGMTE